MCKKLYNYSSPSIIMRLPDLTPLKRMLLFTLSSMLERKQKPSQGLLAYAINTSPANISSLLNDLEKENWITISKASNRFSGELNQYKINWKKIESYAGEKDYYETNEIQTTEKTEKELDRRNSNSTPVGKGKSGLEFNEWLKENYNNQIAN